MDCGRWLSPLLMEKRYQPAQCCGGAVLTAVAWSMFLEDYMVLDSVLFIASHPLAQAVVFTRPIFLVALTYVAFKQWEIDLR